MLKVEGLAKHFGGVTVFTGVSFEAATGQVTALIGPNGAGKSTMVNIICGVFPGDAGTIEKDGRNLKDITPARAVEAGIARTYQDVRLFPTLTLAENVLVAFPGQAGDQVHRLFMPGWKAQERRNREQALALLSELGIADYADTEAEQVPFGVQRLATVARAAATGADTLLLDEPAAGIETAHIPRLTGCVKRLRDEGRTVVFIDHNVDVVAEVADQVVVLQGTVIASGDTESVLRNEQVIKEYLGRIYDA